MATLRITVHGYMANPTATWKLVQAGYDVLVFLDNGNAMLLGACHDVDGGDDDWEWDEAIRRRGEEG